MKIHAASRKARFRQIGRVRRESPDAVRDRVTDDSCASSRNIPTALYDQYMNQSVICVNLRMVAGVFSGALLYGKQVGCAW